MKKFFNGRTARRSAGRLLSLFILLLSAGVFSSALAQESAPASEAPRQGTRPKLSSGVEAILKMVRAGVSKEVVKTYIENSRRFPVTPDEVIALKEQAVPDEITTALLKRGAPAEAGFSAPGGDERGAQVRAAAPRVMMDPESYEFWWYHYAYPRTLASAYERLYSYYPPAVSPFLSPWPTAPFSYGWPSMDVAAGGSQRSALQTRALRGQFAIGQNSFWPGH